MVKLAKLALGVAGVTVAAWSGGWFYGKSEIRSQLNAQVVEMRGQGIAASYSSVEIGGFPFGYQGRVVAPKTQAMMMTAQGPARVDWQTPWISFDTSLRDFGVVNFAAPEPQTGQVVPTNGAAPVDFVITSNGLRGRLASEGENLRVDGGGEAIEIEVTPQNAAPYQVSVPRLAASATAPVDKPGRITAALELDGATANDSAWRLFDPAQGFPRDPANLKVIASADTALRSDNSIEIRAMKVDSVAVDVAGLTLDGEGDAVVKNRRPEGAMTLRFSGLGGFLGNAVTAGFLPEGQADLYRVMLDSFAKAGDRAGEQVYTIEFRNGFMLVNGSTTFIPAPVLP